jgi:hypothetical protein
VKDHRVEMAEVAGQSREPEIFFEYKEENKQNAEGKYRMIKDLL